MSLREDAQIDKNALDFEWERQSSLVAKYLKKNSTALFDRDTLKAQLELLDADLSLEIRADPERFNLTKVTDKAVNAIVIKSKEYQELQKELIKKNRDVNAFFGAQKMLEHKKAGLEYLSRLYFTGYWSDPKIPKDIKDAYSQEVSNQHTHALLKNKRIGGRHGKKESK